MFLEKGVLILGEVKRPSKTVTTTISLLRRNYFILSLMYKNNSEYKSMRLSVRELWGLSQQLKKIGTFPTLKFKNKHGFQFEKQFIAETLYCQIKRMENDLAFLLFRCWYDGRKARKCLHKILIVQSKDFPQFSEAVYTMAGSKIVQSFEPCWHDNCEAYMACCLCHPLPRVLLN